MKHINKNQFIVFICLIIVVLVVINVGYSHTLKLTEDLPLPMEIIMADNPEIIVGHDESYPPFSMLEDDQASGFAVDLTNYTLNEAGYHVGHVIGPWHEMVRQLENDEIDVISTMCINEKRQARLHFSMTTFVTNGTVFSSRKYLISTLKEMTDCRVAVLKDGAIYDELMDQGLKAEYVFVESPLDALKRLENGDVTYAALTEEVALYYIQMHDIDVINNHLRYASFENAFVSKDLALIQRINNSLNLIHRRGTYQKLYDKWLGMTINKHRLMDYGLTLLLALMAVVLLNLNSLVVFFNKKKRPFEVSAKKACVSSGHVQMVLDGMFFLNKQQYLKKDIKNECHHLQLRDMKKAIKTSHVKTMIKNVKSNRGIQAFCLMVGEKNYLVKIMLGHDDDVLFLCKLVKPLDMEDKISYLKTHDHLTGLYCRNYIYELLEESHHFQSVILMDVNGLKIINDSFGHKKGDEILVAVAKVLKSCDSSHVVSRYDGDEFLILTNLKERSSIDQLIEKMKMGIQQIQMHNIFISVSFGWALIHNHMFHEAISEAQSKLSKNKIYGSASFKSKIIETIMNTLHETNLREEAHSQRVSSYCGTLAEAMGFTEEEVNEIMIAGLLHDIGKVTIPEQILNKAGKFSDEEYEIMKSHAIKGYSILSKIDDMMDIAKYIKYHHERWDGKGYPHQLEGKQIPIQSRMITIADAFDAMISTRCYKTALSETQAIRELINGKGTQFDPMLTDLFIKEVLGRHDDIMKIN